MSRRAKVRIIGRYLKVTQDDGRTTWAVPNRSS